MDDDGSTHDLNEEHLRVVDEFLSCHLGTVQTDGWFSPNAAGTQEMNTSHINSDTTLSNTVTTPEVINDAVVQMGTIEPSKIIPIQDNGFATVLSGAWSYCQASTSMLPSTGVSQSQQEMYYCSPSLPVIHQTNESISFQNMNSFLPQCQFSQQTQSPRQASIRHPTTNNVTLSQQCPREPSSTSKESHYGTFIGDLMTTLPYSSSVVQNKSMCTIASNDQHLHNIGNSHKLGHEASPVIEVQAKFFQTNIPVGQQSTRLGQESIKCHSTQGNKTFVRQNISEDNILDVAGEESFHCDVCNTRFKCLWHLEMHSCVHTNEKPFTCTKCDKNFQDKYSLKMHHCTYNREEKTFSSDPCHEKFSNKLRLDQHYSSHHTNKEPWVCSICHREFLSESIYLKHLWLVHPDEKPFGCDLCQKMFFKRSTSNKHYRIHTGEKPFRCNICQKEFTFKRSLTLHYYTHKDERPHKCDRCPKKFTRKWYLSRHYSRVHTV